MKVIMAGYSKTGTKTMCEVLSMLGYKTYDVMEHFFYHGDIWNRILTSGGTIDDFKKMYEKVDAVTDAPAYYFWEQIHEAFPDAKIILTIRDEDSWFKSFKQQKISDNSFSNFIVLAPTFPILELRKFLKLAQNVSRVLWGLKHSITGDGSPNELVSRLKFRQHNNYVMQVAPKDKLLVYKVTDGWEPLCRFLDKEVPSEPFPHKNINSSLAKDIAEKHPIAIANKRRNKHHLLTVLGVFTGIIAMWCIWW